MGKTRPILLVMALALGGCSLSGDFEDLCTMAQEIEKDPSIPPPRKLSTLSQRFDSIWRTGAMKQTMEHLANQAPEKRYSFLRGMAKVGEIDWTCPALKRLFAL